MSQVGTVEVIATIDTTRYKQGADEIDKQNDKIEGSTEKASSGMNKAFDGVAKVGFAALVTAAVAAGAAIVSNIGNAIERIDTLVAFPRVLQAMGISATDANKATKTLADSLKGLPTSLQEGAKSVQGFVSSGLDVNTATKAFLGVNNALLATGSNAQDTQVVMDGLQRVISSGSGDVSTLQAILGRMPTVLSALSKESGKSQDELFKLFSENPQALLDSIIRLNEQGGAGMQSLDKQAREATGGISTGFDNMNNAITRGIEGIVKAIGNGSLEEGQRKISEGIAGIGVAFESVLKGAAEFFNFLRDNKDIIGTVAAAIGTLVAGITAWVAVTKVLRAAQVALNVIMAANPIGIIIIAIAALVAGLIYFFTQTELGKEILKNFFKFIGEAFTNIVKWASDTWNSVLKFFSDAWTNIKNVFNGVGSFFKGVWDTIVRVFGSIGTAIGDAIGNAFKSVINGVLRFAVNTINGFIDAINTVIGVIKNIPGTDGLKKIGRLAVPQLANGGIISSATLAMIGEGSEPEAVIPLSKLDEMLNNTAKPGSSQQVTVRIPEQSSAEYRQGAINTIKAYNEYLKSQSLPPIGVAR